MPNEIPHWFSGRFFRPFGWERDESGHGIEPEGLSKRLSQSQFSRSARSLSIASNLLRSSRMVLGPNLLCVTFLETQCKRSRSSTDTSTSQSLKLNGLSDLQMIGYMYTPTALPCHYFSRSKTCWTPMSLLSQTCSYLIKFCISFVRGVALKWTQALIATGFTTVGKTDPFATVVAAMRAWVRGYASGQGCKLL